MAPASPLSPRRAALVEEHTSYAKSLALDLAKVLPRSLDRDDLVSAAHEGLIDAAKRYDPKRGAKFTTYAYYRIRGAVYDYARKMLGTDAGARTRINGMVALDDHVEAASNLVTRDDSPDEAAATFLGLVETAVGIFTVVEAAEAHATKRGGTPESQSAAMEMARLVLDAINDLPEKERTMIREVYYVGRTIEEAGEALKLSKSWASRLHARAIEMLRDRLHLKRELLR